MKAKTIRGAVILPGIAQLVTFPVFAQGAEDLEQVTVQSTRISTASKLDEDLLEVPFNASVVTRETIDQQGAATLEEAMRSIPGLQHGTQGNYYTRFETRGLRDTQDVLTLIDGVPLRLIQGNADVVLVPTELVDRIEFVKGPASSIYGKNAIGGAVQFFTRSDPDQPLETKLTYGSFGKREISGKGAFDLGGLELSAGIGASDSDGFQDRTDTKRRYGTFALSGSPTERWRTTLSAFGSKVHADRGSIVPLANGRPLYGIDQEDNFGIPGVYIEGEYYQLALRNEWDLSPNLRIELLNSASDYSRWAEGGITIVPAPAAVSKGYSLSELDDRGYFHDLTLSWKHTLGPLSGELLSGINIERGHQDQDNYSFTGAPTYRGPNYNTPVTNVNNDPRGIRGAVVTSRFEQEVNSFYVQERLGWRAYGLTLGARYDDFDQSLSRTDTSVVSGQDKSRLSLRVGADWRVLSNASQDIALFANYVEGFRPQAPTISTLNGVDTPSLLKPEIIESWEAGLKGRSSDQRLSWSASYFQMTRTDGQRSFRTGPDTFIFTNASSRIDGIESDIRFAFNEQWSGYANYSWHDARHLDFPVSPTVNYAGNRVRMSAEHIAGLGLTWHYGAWTLASSANYVGERPLRDNIVNPQILPSYTLVGLTGSWDVNRSLRVQAGINNLLDEYYINDDFSAQEAGNAGAPLNYFVSARWRFAK